MEGEGDYEGVFPAEEESSESTTCEKAELEMEHLPNEMLKSTLEELVVVDPERPSHWSQESWGSTFQSVIAYRQVCSTWRDFLDEILEKSLLSTVRAWCPPNPCWNSDPTPLSKVQIFYPQTIGLRKDEIPCPPPLIGYNGSNPFPGKAVEVVFNNYGWRDVEFRTQITINLMDLFTKVGHHLSLLFLNRLWIVDLDVLVSILERSPNLKALVIRNLTVTKGWTSPGPPPALPQLKTLVIESVQMGLKVKSRFRLVPPFSQWLVEPYARQLVQLVNDFQAPVTAPLPNLKQLTLRYPTLTNLQQNGPAVSLLRLCVSIGGAGYDWRENICNMFKYLDQFSKTLVDLFLSVRWSNLIPAANDDNEVEEEQQRDPFMEELRRVYGKLPTSKVNFPRLKTLAFPYPETEMQVMLLSRTVLPKFPALEELHFLYFRETFTASYRYRQARKTISEFLEMENIWAICRKLQKITAIGDGGGRNNEEGGLFVTLTRNCP